MGEVYRRGARWSQRRFVLGPCQRDEDSGSCKRPGNQ